MPSVLMMQGAGKTTMRLPPPPHLAQLGKQRFAHVLCCGPARPTGAAVSPKPITHSLARSQRALEMYRGRREGVKVASVP